MKVKEFLMVAAAVVLVAGCGDGKQVSSTKEQRVEVVQTSIIGKQVVSRQIELSTILEGYETMNISPSVTGLIEHIYVEVGDKVKKGDTLVRMDQNQLRTTRLTFSNLQLEMNRMEALLESNAISQQNYDQTKLAYDQTEEALSFLEENTFVRAQFDGVITAKNYEDGELYGGQPILVLKQLSNLKALVNIPESFFPQVKKGQKVEVKSDIYSGRLFSGSVEIVYPTIDPASHTFSVKLKIPNHGETLRPGMYVNTVLDMGSKETLVIPYQSVLRLVGSNERYVYLNENGTAKRVFVETGTRHDENIEITGDSLSEGDELITTGQSKLVDGVKLKIEK